MRRLNRIERFIALTALTLGLSFGLVACDSDSDDEIDSSEELQDDEQLAPAEPNPQPNTPYARMAEVLDTEESALDLVGYADGCGDFGPGDVWAEDCNVCTCADDGTALCTQQMCEDPSGLRLAAGTADDGLSIGDAKDLDQYVPEPEPPTPPLAGE